MSGVLKLEPRQVYIFRMIPPLSPHGNSMRGTAAGIPRASIPNREKHGVGVIKQLGQPLRLVDDLEVAPLKCTRPLGFGRCRLEERRAYLDAIVAERDVEAIVPPQ